MDKRTVLAVVLSLLVLLIYQVFFFKPPAPKHPGAVQKETAVAAKPAAETATPTSAGSASAPVISKSVTSLETAVAEKDVVVETPLYRAVFSTKGGTLKSLQLKKYLTTLKKDAQPIELVGVTQGMPKPFALSFSESSFNLAAPGVFTAGRNSLDLTKTKESGTLTLTQVYPGEMKIEKIFTFHPGKYDVGLEVKVYNLSPAPITQNAILSWFQYVDPEKKSESYSHEGPVSFVAKNIDRPEVKKLEQSKTLGPDVSWGGYESKYFLAAMVPQNPSLTTLSIGKDKSNMVAVSLIGPKNIIPPGQAGLYDYSLYLGPKDYNILKAEGIGLENAIDFGSWLKWLAMPLLLALKFLYSYVHNYGIAIIILTLIIKIIFWPLGNKSYRSMKEMQKLQPKMAAIREKYKDDRARMSQETMALYKTHKINPLSGCLPMIIQIPVFFGLYKALLYAIELRHSPFFFWIQDLSAKDPYYIAPIIMGGT
ncbi:MAG: membrane protein insertase YidC, partial [Smithellaceae bacterium]|nr:membrane protein insertase YidC [Smithellaceae bacterium]